MEDAIKIRFSYEIKGENREREDTKARDGYEADIYEGADKTRKASDTRVKSEGLRLWKGQGHGLRPRNRGWRILPG